MESREVSREEGECLAALYKIPYIETSVVQGFNVSKVFETLARTLIARKNGDEPCNSVFV